jgi:hypothetical protein
MNQVAAVVSRHFYIGGERQFAATPLLLAARAAVFQADVLFVGAELDIN